MSLSRRRAYVDGVRIHYLVAGRGHHGLPVVIVPAAHEHAAGASTLLNAIGESRLAFAVDLPGQGLSGQPHGMSRRAPWLRRWLDTAGFERCHLIALGGAAGSAIALAQAAPARIASLALVSPPWPGDGSFVERAVTGARAATPTPRGAIDLLARARATVGPAEDFAVSQALPMLAHVPVQTAVVRAGSSQRSLLDAPELVGSHVRAIELPGGHDPAYRHAPATTASALDDWWHELEDAASPAATTTKD